MIPTPVTLATAPEAQPIVESSQLVAAVSSNSVSRVEPELPSIKHIVAAEDTFWSVAQRYSVSVEAISQLNSLTADSPLTVGQAIKIPTQFNNQPVAAVPQLSAPKRSVEVAALQPTVKADVEQNALKDQEDEALSTLRAKQENLTESIKQLRNDSTVVLDAEVNAPQPQPQTLISSTVLNTVETAKTPAGGVVISVPLPNEAKKVQAQASTTSRTLIANGVVSASRHLPTPPTLTAPKPELVVPTTEEKQPASIILNVPTAPATVIRTENNRNESSTLVAARFAGKTHKVSQGETLYAIARRYGVSGHELIAANGLDNPNVIKVNQHLVIPALQQAANAPTSFVALLPQTEVTQEVNRDSETLASAATLTQPEAQAKVQPEGEKAVLTFEISTESAVDKLKTDIARMRQEYQQQQQQVAIAPKAPVVQFTLNNNNPATQTSIDSEWQGRQSKSVAIAPTAVAETQTIRALPEATQEIAAASGDVVNYNSLLRMSVGEVVAPNLPPLAAPDQYLPGSAVFNGYIWPAKGTLTSGFGPRWGRMHRGIDIAAPVGTPIFAAADGEVISAGWNSGGYGNLVKIQHPDGSVTLYAHNSSISVRKGQQVQQGEQISAMGSTGFSTGPHLHFEVHPSGKGAINPIALLPKK